MFDTSHTLFETLPNAFQTFVDTFTWIVNAFFGPSWYIYERFASSLPEPIFNFVENLVGRSEAIQYVLDQPFVLFMLGDAIAFFITYQLIIWILNSVT